MSPVAPAGGIAAFDHPRNAEALRRLRRTLDSNGGGRLRRLLRRPFRVVRDKLLQPLFASDLLSFRLRTRLFWGGTMTTLVPEGAIFLRLGYYDELLTGAVIERVTPGMTFIDVGAHFGYFTLLASHLVGDAGEVHAFEPVPRTFEILARNAASRRNVRIHRCAVFSGAAELSLNDMGPRYGGYSSFVPPRLDGKRAASVRPRVITVPAVSLDAYTRGWRPRPTFIKIDAESAESAVFQGMQETVKRLRPVIAFEVGDFELERVPRSRELIRQVCAMGYDAFSIRGGSLVPHELQETYTPGSIVALPRPV